MRVCVFITGPWDVVIFLFWLHDVRVCVCVYTGPWDVVISNRVLTTGFFIYLFWLHNVRVCVYYRALRRSYFFILITWCACVCVYTGPWDVVISNRVLTTGSFIYLFWLHNVRVCVYYRALRRIYFFILITWCACVCVCVCVYTGPWDVVISNRVLTTGSFIFLFWVHDVRAYTGPWYVAISNRVLTIGSF